jgi:hypothetical protein
VLTTARLRLRAPQREDAPAIAVLANDRRIAENTARIPHPYTLADAEGFLAYLEESEIEIAFAITLADDTLIGICGLRMRQRKMPEIGYWLGAPFWGHGYATEAARALIDHAFEEPGITPGPGKVRFPVERRGAAAHPRARLLGPDGSLPARPRTLGLAQGLGRGQACGVTPPATGTLSRG